MTPPTLFHRFTSIVREQHSRLPDSGTARGARVHQDMTDTELDTALANTEQAFIAAMDTARTDAFRRDDYADNMRAALASYAEAITRRETVIQPRDRALAVCDVDRQKAYVTALGLFPEAADVLAALDVVENEARVIETAVSGGGASAETARAVDDAAGAAWTAGSICHVLEREPYAYTVFLLALGPYTRLRSHLPADGPELDVAAVAALRLGSRLDRAREDMADAAARVRRARLGSLGSGSRSSVTGSV